MIFLGSRDHQQREKPRSAPPPVEEPLPVISASPQPIVSLTKLNKRKESITIDIDNGESSSDQLDLVQEELERAQTTDVADTEQEPEATTEDELLKDEKTVENEAHEEGPIESRDDEEDCEESESCSVSLRSSKQIQSLPPTPKSCDSARSSQQSAESVNSTKHLLSASNTPKTQVKY